MRKSNQKRSKLSGPKIATLYSLTPNRLGFCGPQEKDNQEKLRKFLLGEFPEKEARKIISKFEAAYAYYKTIAKKNKIRDPLDRRVVEAYWLGNKLLEKVSAEDLKEMIFKNFVKPGLLSKEKAIERSTLIPKKSKAHHSFHVFILGSVTGRVDFGQIKLQDICRIGWGKVISVKGSRALVEYRPIVKGKRKIKFGQRKKKELDWDQEINPSISLGDWVSFHWNFLVQKLEKEDIENLIRYTKINMN